ncbi:MAG: hypothetical protein GY906_09390 [bacterium]|nr:hypothetical protein [bacterium]
MRVIAKTLIILTALAIALVLGVVGGSAPAAETQATEDRDTPLKDFQPTEKLPSDSAVAFPTDI